MFNRTIDEIVSGLTTVAQQLINLADNRAKHAADCSTKALELNNKANVAMDEGARAVRIAKKLEEILK